MHKLSAILLTGILFFSLLSYGQGENNIWIWGYNNQLDFNQAPPVYSNNSNIESAESSATVSDAQGNLLFYTMGARIWDRNGNEMPNATGLSGNGPINPLTNQPYGSCMWGVQIVPNPANTNQYYVFSGDPYTSSPYNRKIYYHIVDMSLNNGLGDVLQKNNVLMEHWIFNEGIYVLYGTCRSYWLVVAQGSAQSGDSLLAYKIDENGIDLNPVVTVPALQGLDFLGYTRVNKKSNIAFTITNLGLMRHQFNRSTGEFTNFEVIPQTGNFPQGLGMVRNYLEFAPGGKYLYFMGRLQNGQNMGLMQFDISLYPDLNALTASRVERALNQLMGYRLAPDGKIYGFSASSSNPGLGMADIDVIETPDELLTTANYTAAFMTFPQVNSNSQLFNPEYLPLKTVPDTFESLLPVIDSLICKDDNLTLRSSKEGMTEYIWNDGATGIEKIIDQPGIYWVYALMDDCEVHIDTFKLKLLEVNLTPENDTAICDGDVLTLDAFDPVYENYLWSNGATGPRITVALPGTYSVRVGLAGCYATDTIRVTGIYPDLSILQGDTTICDNSSVVLTAVTNMGSSIVWTNGIGLPAITVGQAGRYTAQTENICGIQSDSVTIDVVNCDCIPVFPTAFSPNGDGKNDAFTPLLKATCQAKSFEFVVYNRYGQLVFSSNQKGLGWDGTYQSGRPAELGVYYYILKVANNYGEVATNVYKGELTLVR